MQIGWAQINSAFSDVNGVGDVNGTYAYDGDRQFKLNGINMQYGEKWSNGDVIGCMIDLESKTISYSRNGTDLGIAFFDVHTGPNIAYFPAISMKAVEKATFNFGALPFNYTQEEYYPM